MNSFVAMNCIWFVLVLFVNIIWYRRMNKLNLDWYKECISILDDYSVEMAKIIEGDENDDNNKEETDAVEWIDYNTIRALPYMGGDAPLILYKLIL